MNVGGKNLTAEKGRDKGKAERSIELESGRITQIKKKVFVGLEGTREKPFETFLRRARSGSQEG